MHKKIDFSELYNNLTDVIKECQIKIGYTDNELNFYYPVKALQRFMEAELDIEQLNEALTDFAAYAADTLGEIRFRLEGERYRFTVPKKGAAYVRDNIPDSPFLKEFIEETVRTGCTIDSVLEIFKKYSDCVICEKTAGEDAEFEYLIYFRDGKPESYRYCLEFEFGRAVYHRFTVKEYEALQL